MSTWKNGELLSAHDWQKARVSFCAMFLHLVCVLTVTAIFADGQQTMDSGLLEND